MVFQQKVGSATKNKSKKDVQSTKTWMFEFDASDKDDDDLDIEIDSIDVQDPLKTPGKKSPQTKTHCKQTLAKQTPNKQTPAKPAPGKQTPAKPAPGKQTPAKLAPGKQTPAKLAPGKRTPAKLTSPGNRTPAKQTPAKQTPAKQTPAKQPVKQTPGKQIPAKQQPGKQTPAKETPGKQTPTKQTPGKQTPNKKNLIVPDKEVGFELATAKTPKATNIQMVGKRQATPASNGNQEFRMLKVGLNNKSKTPMKMDNDDKEADNDDAGEVDDDEDDGEEDDYEEADDDDDEADDDDDDEADDDDDEADDDDDDDEADDDEDEEVDDDDDEEDSKQNVLVKDNQNLQQIKNQTPVKKEASTNTETDSSSTKQNENLCDTRSLIFRTLPVDITREEILSLSDDIINVKLHASKMFALVEFASEEKAEANYAAFQNQKLRGEHINLDYIGVKSKNPTQRECELDAMYNTKRLCVYSLPLNVKINQIAKLTPNATSVKLFFENRAVVIFDSEEGAAEAFEANKEAKINSKPVTFEYCNESSIERYGGGGSRPFYKDGQTPFAKRPRQDFQPTFAKRPRQDFQPPFTERPMQDLQLPFVKKPKHNLDALTRSYVGFWRNFSV